MSLYDREYAREPRQGTRGGLPAFFVLHPAVAWILTLNIGVFILWLALGRENPFLLEHFTFSAEGVLRHYRLHTLLTSVFSHSDPWHLLFNMLILWFFARDLEQLYGTRDFLVLYLCGGLLASLTQLAVSLAGWMPPNAPVLGASGALMGVMAVQACLYPHRTVLLFMVIPIPMRWLVWLYVALDLLGLFSTAMGEPSLVANAAHLGGLAWGFLYYRLDLRLFGRADVERPGLWRRFGQVFRRRPHLRVVDRRKERSRRDEVADEFDGGRVDGGGSAGVDDQTAARVDALLAKIHREGLGSLTAEEREFLMEASTKYKR